DWGSVSPEVEMAPTFFPSPNWRHFGGKIAALTLVRRALSADEIGRLFQADGKDKDQWILGEGWSMTPAPNVTADGAAISRASFRAGDWWPATVPGTALTTMIDRGVYPDPDYGFYNLGISQSLNKQDYWYRAEFRAPKAMGGRRLTLTFDGINYEALVWLNGESLGPIKGVFR